jgi:ribosomal protein L7/L12
MEIYEALMLLGALGYAVHLLQRVNSQLRATEAELDALMRHFGVLQGAWAEPSDEVKALAKDPRRHIDAIRAYRQRTGAELREAKEVV